MSPTELHSRKPKPAESALEIFIACAHQMLDPATPEPVRRAVEPQLLAQLPALRALGVFDLMALRDPAMRAWVGDELEAMETSARASTAVFLLKQT